MTAAALPVVHKTMRTFPIKAFEAKGFADVSPWSKPGLPVPIASQPLKWPHPISGGDISGVKMCLALPAGGRNMNLGLDISVADWDLLFNAIKSRLRLVVGDRSAETPAPEAGDTAGGVQAAVLDCIFAMDLLHAALTFERNCVSGSGSFDRRP